MNGKDGKPVKEYVPSFGDWDDNGRREVECSHLVWWAVNKAVKEAVHAPAPVPYLNTAYFIDPRDRTDWETLNPLNSSEGSSGYTIRNY